jgi:hypothetical protein
MPTGLLTDCSKNARCIVSIMSIKFNFSLHHAGKGRRFLADHMDCHQGWLL